MADKPENSKLEKPDLGPAETKDGKIESAFGVESNEVPRALNPEGDRRVSELIDKLKEEQRQAEVAPVKAETSLQERAKERADLYLKKMMAAGDNYDQIEDIINEAAGKDLNG